jgi:TetR/AcrR family transcriptional repressor of nem operon
LQALWNLVDNHLLNEFVLRSKPIRKSRADAAATKAGIVEAASRAFKRRGFDGVGMAGLMAAAGLSHGAAYRHFPAKGALAAACLVRSMETSVARAKAAPGVAGWLAGYLKPARVADAGDGCAFAALAVDVARAEDAALSGLFAAGLADFAAALQTAIPDLDRPAALRLIAQAAGALILMRATKDEAIATDFRTACLGS